MLAGRDPIGEVGVVIGIRTADFARIDITAFAVTTLFHYGEGDAVRSIVVRHQHAATKTVARIQRVF